MEEWIIADATTRKLFFFFCFAFQGIFLTLPFFELGFEGSICESI